MLDLRTRTLFLGLLDDLKEFADLNDYSLEIDGEMVGDQITKEELKEFIGTLNLPFEERYYQFDTIFDCINNNRNVIISPTASGKSLNSYILARYHNAHDRKTLIVVPTISLVNQLHSDFVEYNNGNDVSLQKIKGGMSKEVVEDMVVSTWQSLINMDNEWFDQFDAIVGDECHKYKAKCTSDMMKKCTTIAYRNGMTGSLNEKNISNMLLTGLFGPIREIATTKQLQDEGYLANHIIKCIILKYTKEQIKEYKKYLKYEFENRKGNSPSKKYKIEADWVYSFSPRDDFLIKLAKHCKGNTIVMFRYTDHGERFFELLKNSTDRNVYFVNGGVDGDDREEIRKIVDSSKDNIIVASTGVFSTGVNIKSIQNIINIAPNKAEDEIQQIIGRGIRLHEDKTYCNVFDIVDDLRSSTAPNYLLKHFYKRVEFYDEKQYTYKIIKYSL